MSMPSCRGLETLTCSQSKAQHGEKSGRLTLAAAAFNPNPSRPAGLSLILKLNNIVIVSSAGETLMHLGAIEKLLDPELKLSPKYSNRIARMVRAASACVNTEESRRPGIDEIISILRGQDPKPSNRPKKSNFTVADCYPQLQQTRSEMKSHFALAMLGVSDFEEINNLHCR